MIVSSYASGTEIACIVCVLLWGNLALRNYRNGYFLFMCGDIALAVGYLIAIAQYYFIFWVAYTVQDDTAMMLLFGRMVLHCTGPLIFNYHYRVLKQ